MTSLFEVIGYYPIVKIDNVEVAGDVMARLAATTIDNSLNLPDVCVLEFVDHDSVVAGNSSFAIGKPVVVSVKPSAGRPTQLFTGELVAIECDFDYAVGQRTIVRAYDRSHRLHRGRKTKAWLNVSYSDVVRQVARANGVTVGTIDASGEVHDHVTQANLDDWRFLRGLAAKVGFDLTVEQGKLHFRNPNPASAGPDANQLDPTVDLTIRPDDGTTLRLRVSTSASAPVSTVTVRGWNPQAKQPVTGTASLPANARGATNGIPLPGAVTTFGSRTHTVADPSLRTQASAQKLATATMAELAGAAAEVEAEIFGNPQMMPGKAIGVGGLGAKLSGKYTVSATRHVITEVGYTTIVTVSDRQDRSMLGTVGSGGTALPAGLGNGVVPAVVTNNNDAEKQQGRVKVKFPWLDDAFETDWIRVVQAGAGPTRGFTVLPEVNDEVLVAFENGDVNRPYVLGGLFNGVEKSKLTLAETVQNGKVLRRGFHSRKGHHVVFFDAEDDTQSIELKLGNAKATVLMGGGTTGVKIDTTEDVLVKTAKNAKVEATQNVTVQASQNVDVKSTSGNVTVKAEAGTVTVEGATQATLKATNVTVEATAALKLKGSTVEIQSAGPLTAKGLPIKLN